MKKSDLNGNTHEMETMQTKISITAPNREAKVEIVARMTDITARSVGIMGVQMVILCMACDSPFSLSMLEVFDVHRDNTVDVPNLCPSCGGYTPIDAGAEIVYGMGRFPSDSSQLSQRKGPKR
jgi:hypothetical protein